MLISRLSAFFLIGAIYLLAACNDSGEDFSQIFFKHRPCHEIKFKCLEDKKENVMKLPSTPYVLTEDDYAQIESERTLKMYKNFIQMLEIYYPGFWEDVEDEQTQLDWMVKVDKIISKYSPRRTEGELGAAAHICALIGVDFETNPKFQFVVEKLKHIEYDTLGIIIDYIRFEILKKDYDEAGNQYNNWSLRGFRVGMPPVTRHVPDFDNEWKPYSSAEDRYYIYRRDVLKEVK